MDTRDEVIKANFASPFAAFYSFETVYEFISLITVQGF